MNKLLLILVCSLGLISCSAMQLKPTVGVSVGTAL